MPDMEKHFNFMIHSFWVFGLAFEVPVVIMVLAKFGWVKHQQLVDFRRYMLVINFIIAAVVTPPDVLSQLMLAIPLCLLYELGLLMARYFQKNQNSQKNQQNQ
jgi:sec-independent protein translocase protein TatC